MKRKHEVPPTGGGGGRGAGAVKQEEKEQKKDPDWKRLIIPETAEFDFKTIKLKDSTTLWEEAQRLQQLRIVEKGSGTIYQMRSEEYLGKQETNECRDFIERSLKDVNPQLAKEFADQRTDYHKLRQNIVNMFLLARATLSCMSLDDSWLLSKHGNTASFLDQMMPWLLKSFMDKKTFYHERFGAQMERMMKGASRFHSLGRYKQKVIKVGDLVQMQKDLMANSKSMQDIFSPECSLPKSVAMQKIFDVIHQKNSECHQIQCQKTSDLLGG